ncbi:hypothetical protein EBY67_07295 [bacterium]|nr:hypothetical protein [bacterium]
MAGLHQRQHNRTEDSMLSRRLAEYLSYERTMAFDKDIEAKVAALTLEQVNQAVKEVFKLESLSVVAAGDFAGAAKATAK